MAIDEEIQNALLAIHSRLGTIEGKVTLVARADRKRILEALKEVVEKNPLVAQIYLLLDGKRNQGDIFEELGKRGIKTSAMGVSRRMREMETEYGIADLVQGGRSKILRKNREMEDVLNLFDEHAEVARRAKGNDPRAACAQEEPRMNDATPGELQRLLAAKFGNRGWEWDLVEGRKIVEAIEKRGEVDPDALAERISSTYLDRNGATGGSWRP